jgi:hypothetical protein
VRRGVATEIPDAASARKREPYTHEIAGLLRKADRSGTVRDLQGHVCQALFAQFRRAAVENSELQLRENVVLIRDRQM